jgi:predicted ATPase
MINSIQIQNFKNLRDVQTDLAPLTVFVGANASGKTSVLQAIHLAVRAAGRFEPQLVFSEKQHCAWLYSRDGSGALSIACKTSGGTFAPEGGIFRISAEYPHVIPSSKQSEDLRFGRWEFQLDPSLPSDLADASEGAGPIEFLHLNTDKLTEPAYLDYSPPRLESDGEGLAAVLAYMALNNPDGFDEVVAWMRTLIPYLRRIRFSKSLVQRVEKEFVRFGDDTVERQSKREYQGDIIVFDFFNADNVGAHTVSEGTMMLLGLLTVLLGPTRPSVLLLDNIEQGLHPLAQKSLLNVLRQVMQRFPGLQILATAHSPYLLDQLQPEEIRLMAVGDDGYAVCGRLDDHPQFEKWKDEMAPGELWSLFGEKWLPAEESTK